MLLINTHRPYDIYLKAILDMIDTTIVLYIVALKGMYSVVTNDSPDYIICHLHFTLSYFTISLSDTFVISKYEINNFS